MAKNPGSVRSSQLVTTYGVGSLVAAGDESFIVAGIEDWPENERFTMHEPRLERILRVNRFMRPPYSDQDGSRDVPVRRFPRQHSCPQCHRLNDIMFFNNQFGENTCTRCEGEPRLVPSRFVVACANGHLDEFPYFGWVHQQKPHPEGEKPKLKLERAASQRVSTMLWCRALVALAGVCTGRSVVRRCRGLSDAAGSGRGSLLIRRRNVILSRSPSSVVRPTSGLLRRSQRSRFRRGQMPRSS